MTDSQDDTQEQPDDAAESATPPSERTTTETNSVMGIPLRRYLALGAIGVLVVLVLVSVYQLYTSVSTTIDIWFTEAYAPFFRAAFNLVVLLVALAGLTLLLRRKDDLFSAL